MDATDGSIISGVSQIPGCVEGLFDTKTIVLQKVPILL
jgi:hypothetical protein